ncbi:MAG: nucleotidyltransferase family protein [Cyanobacteria bacterium]|nr:nucleotidyltransferase family protein [Cyanobacteriota bacterium]
MNRIAIAILAAGQGSRMDGEVKQLVRFGDESLVTRAVRTAKESSVGEVYVVLGYMLEHLRELLRESCGEQSSISIIENPEWSEGIASSIRAAVKAVESYDAVMFMTVDQPFVDAKWLNLMRDKFVETRSEVVASSYGEPPSPGIPALFSKTKYSALSMLQGDRGAKQVIKDSDALLLNSALASYDIDTIRDLEECLRIQYSSVQSPSR